MSSDSLRHLPRVFDEANLVLVTVAFLIVNLISHKINYESYENPIP